MTTLPFSLASDLDLSSCLALPSRPEAFADVVISAGSVPETLDCEPFEPGFYVEGDIALLHIDDEHSFLIERGERVTYRPGPNVKAYLAGTVLGILCYQRRLMPLHASAVTRNGCVHAFTGPSGSGKSSMALALCQRGWKFFTDDILAVSITQQGKVECYAVQSRAKLWEDSVSHLGVEPSGEAYRRLDRIKHLADPDLVDMSHGQGTGTLASLSFVQPDPCIRTIHESLYGADAMRLLVASLYRPKFGTLICGKAWLFDCLSRIANNSSIERLIRPEDWSLLSATLHQVTRHLNAMDELRSLSSAQVR